MAWSNLTLVRDFFLNQLHRLPEFIPAAIGPDATARLDAAITAEYADDDTRAANLDQAAALLEIAGETQLAATVRNAKPKEKRVTT